MNYETTLEMELAIMRFFNFRQNLIVPNVSWGLNLHECDVLVLSLSGYATEIEIKISKSDLKKDKEKKHDHFSQRIKKLYFAIPEKIDIDFALQHIPERAGLLIIDKYGRVKKVKEAIKNNAIKFTESERYNLARLGAIRIYGLKSKIKKYKE